MVSWICFSAFTGVVSMAGRVYAVGGFNSSLRERTVDVYDVARDQWSAVTSMQERRSTLGAAVLGDLLYAVGGFNGSIGKHASIPKHTSMSSETSTDQVAKHFQVKLKVVQLQGLNFWITSTFCSFIGFDLVKKLSNMSMSLPGRGVTENLLSC